MVCGVDNTLGLGRRDVNQVQAVVGIEPDVGDKQVGRLGQEPGAGVAKIGTGLDHGHRPQDLLGDLPHPRVWIDEKNLFDAAAEVRGSRDQIGRLVSGRDPGDLDAPPPRPHRYRNWLRTPTADIHNHAYRLHTGVYEDHRTRSVDKRVRVTPKDIGCKKNLAKTRSDSPKQRGRQASAGGYVRMLPVLYVARRLGHALLVLFGVSVLSFVLAEAAPGSVFDELKLDPRVSPATIEAMREQYGLDRSFPQKYAHWLRSIARGDLGFSVAHNSPVGPLLWPRARNTLYLTVTATTLAWLIAVPLGTWAASRKGAWPDRLTAGATTALLGVPDLLLGLALLLIAVRSGYFPTGGMVSLGFADLGTWDKVKDVLAHFFLPVTALTLVNLPVLVRHVRASMIEVLQAPFIQAGRAIGMSERRLLFRYALRAAANPLISLLGLSVAALLSASLVIETIMSWPGLGPLLLAAVMARDLHVVVAVVTCSTFLLIAGNLLADALLYWADPRIRPGQA